MRFRLRFAVAALLTVALALAACVHKAPSTHPPVAQIAISGLEASGYISQAQHLTQTLEQQGAMPTALALTIQQALRNASQTGVDELVPLLREIDAMTDDVAKAPKLEKARVLARDLIASSATVFPSLKGNASYAELASLIDKIIASASHLVGDVAGKLGS